MAPSKTKTTTRANNPSRVIITRSIHKKKQQEAAKEEPDSAKSTCTTTTTTSNAINEEYCYIKSTCEDDVVCSTPRGKKYTIPKISTCPPAPKKMKRLVLSRATAAAATKFFSHPDLDVFFLFSSPNTTSLQTLESN